MLLLQQLLPVMRDVSDGFFIFQQDNAPAHLARNTLRSLEHSKPAFIPTDLWLTNSTDMASGINFYSQLVISTIRVSDIANSNYWCHQFWIKVNSAYHTATLILPVRLQDTAWHPAGNACISRTCTALTNWRSVYRTFGTSLTRASLTMELMSAISVFKHVCGQKRTFRATVANWWQQLAQQLYHGEDETSEEPATDGDARWSSQ